jgi:hypothetical protein
MQKFSSPRNVPNPNFAIGGRSCRTFATVARLAKVRELELKGLLNHAIGQDVTAGYIITTTEDLRESAQAVCDRLMELCGIPATEAGIRAVK